MSSVLADPLLQEAQAPARGRLRWLLPLAWIAALGVMLIGIGDAAVTRTQEARVLNMWILTPTHLTTAKYPLQTGDNFYTGA